MNILIIKHGSLGDVILSIGAIQSIRNHYPKEKLFLLTQSNYKKILDKFSCVDDILIDDRGFIIKSVPQILSYIRSYQINLIIDLQNSSRTQLYNFFIKYLTKTRILSSRNFSNFTYKQKPLGIQHITNNHSEQLQFLGIDKYQISDLRWMAKNKYKKKEKPYVIFIPGASKSGDYKRWPISNYGKIANYLVEKKYDIYLTGTQHDE